jgi:regulation of enolase protein 1 (concanavalin A-like superfamily)
VPQDSRLNFPPTQNFATRLVTLLDKEQTQIDVDMYRITDAKPADALIRAVQRGVAVRLYTEQEQYRDPTRLWHSYNVDRMYAAGVQVKDRAHQGLNHQKSTILYGQHTLVFGSSNWTTPSASSQLEHNIFTTENFYFDFFVDQFNRKWNNTGPSPETKTFVPLAPDAPIYAAPANGATAQSQTGVVLKWNAGLWAHKYDIYLGTSPTLTATNLVAADLQLGPSETPTSYRTFTTPALQPGTTYYWQVVSKTMANKTAIGPVWSFTTSGTGSGGGQLPAGWSTADIGAVGAPGNATYDGTTGKFVVSGSGADIWGSADEFRFAYTSLTGDGSIVARVASIGNENAWTKAGVMMRDGLSAGATHATMFVSSAKGLAFQRRATVNGTSTSTAGPPAGAPYWVRMSRSGNTMTAAISTDGANWTTVGTQSIAMNATIQVGLAVTSHLDGTVSTATFDSVSVGTTAPPPPPPPGPLPAGWTSSDVGATTPAGAASFDSATSRFSVSGAGADVWGTADAFGYAYTTLNGDGDIVAKVDSLDNVDVWTKAGVMIRDGLSAGAAHASMFVTPSTLKGTAFQRRPAAGSTSLSTAGPSAAPPYWVKLVRLGTTFSAYASADGVNWTLVGTETIPMGAVVNAGLAVSSHKNGTLATGMFSAVTVTKY